MRILIHFLNCFEINILSEKGAINLVMYILGKVLKKDTKAVAIVGTRIPTNRAKKIAYDFSFYLAGNGITIISGLARGIDTIVHRAALDAGGRTIAVLGTAIDRIYPAENRELAKEIIGSGAIVSLKPAGASTIPSDFKVRNGLVVKLSKAVLVVEGLRRSGTISTAAHAARAGVEVFAIPGSEATNWLIANGATPVQSPQDIVEYINKF